MSLGLSNAKLSANRAASRFIQKVSPARTSIAEDATFIPKLRKRVSFELETASKTGNAGKQSFNTIPLPGSQKIDNADVSGKNILAGRLGENGLTAKWNAVTYDGGSAKIKMVVNNNPSKDFSKVVTQEEGRQTNHANNIHYTQQYDSYGRPIIGFSREPYDFAATKYIAKTSQIKFKENVTRTSEGFNDQSQIVTAEEALEGKAIDSKINYSNNESLQNSLPVDTNNKSNDRIKLPGEKDPETQSKDMEEAQLLGDKTTAVNGNNGKTNDSRILESTEYGISIKELAEKMGIDFNKIFSPNKLAEDNQEAVSNIKKLLADEDVTKIADVHNLSGSRTSTIISLSA